jgi:hypothetical protein
MTCEMLSQSLRGSDAPSRELQPPGGASPPRDGTEVMSEVACARFERFACLLSNVAEGATLLLALASDFIFLCRRYRVVRVSEICKTWHLTGHNCLEEAAARAQIFGA